MSAGLGGAVDRTAAALRHTLQVCVGTDGTVAAAALSAACAVSLLCGLCRSRSGGARLRAALPALVAALLLRRRWPALVRLLVVQLLLSAAAGRPARRPLLWTLLSLLLAAAELCWLAARAPLLPALVFATAAAAVVERCAQWRRAAPADSRGPLPPPTPAAAAPQRPVSLWRFVLRPVGSPVHGAGLPVTAGGDQPGAALRACLWLPAVPPLLLLAVLCEWAFPWDALAFHGRSKPVQLLQLISMWTGQQALWLCPLIVLQAAADIILSGSAPLLAWWPAVRSGSVSSLVAALTAPVSEWLRRLLGAGRLTAWLLCALCGAAAAAAGGARLLLWAALLTVCEQLERLSGLPRPAAALAGRLQLASCAPLLQPQLTSLDVYRTWEELQFVPVLLPAVGALSWIMETAASGSGRGHRWAGAAEKAV
ncbi:hypothetical protein FJT64_014546 [Amphibalanus amphitrite]|uniref:Uncharacterized protein n=1 Tax=Amphibalanus amphitrite TaxID=1232801 RepID=A0A6A4VBG6_AMPAM|nr:hypothetical protein FJT64_014546 [Amphibalanus amphitrite]